jgi:hypothetical protein
MITELTVIFFCSVIFIKFRTDSVYIVVQYISQSMVILTSKEKIKFIYTVKLKLNMKWITIYSILIMKTENFYVKCVYPIIFW